MLGRDEHIHACRAGARCNITHMPAFQGFDRDAPATVLFGHGQSAAAVDTVVYATGYVYSFPFLEGAGIVEVDRNRVHPLYRHVWPPAHAPGIAFVGIPWKVSATPPASEVHILGKAASYWRQNCTLSAGSRMTVVAFKPSNVDWAVVTGSSYGFWAT